WRHRWRTAAARMRPPAWTLAGAGAAVFVATGSWIYYNTHVLNPFVSRHAMQGRQADYERRYKALAGAPQPRITAVDLRVDLFPHQHRARLVGTLTLVNKT